MPCWLGKHTLLTTSLLLFFSSLFFFPLYFFVEDLWQRATIWYGHDGHDEMSKGVSDGENDTVGYCLFYFPHIFLFTFYSPPPPTPPLSPFYPAISVFKSHRHNFLTYILSYPQLFFQFFLLTSPGSVSVVNDFFSSWFLFSFLVVLLLFPASHLLDLLDLYRSYGFSLHFLIFILIFFFPVRSIFFFSYIFSSFSPNSSFLFPPVLCFVVTRVGLHVLACLSILPFLLHIYLFVPSTYLPT